MVKYNHKDTNKIKQKEYKDKNRNRNRNNVDSKNKNKKSKNKKNDKIKQSNKINSKMPNNSRNEDSNEKEYKSNSFNICFEKDLINDSFKTYTSNVNNCFIVFKSYFDILHLIYSTNDSSLISYNLIDNKKIIEIKNNYQKYVSSFKHFFDDINKRDLVISISRNNIILWNICIYKLTIIFN